MIFVVVVTLKAKRLLGSRNSKCAAVTYFIFRLLNPVDFVRCLAGFTGDILLNVLIVFLLWITGAECQQQLHGGFRGKKRVITGLVPYKIKVIC